jgi:hypothetical protein
MNELAIEKVKYALEFNIELDEKSLEFVDF